LLLTSDCVRRAFAVVVGTISLPAMALAQPVVTLPAPALTLPFVPSPSGDWTVTLGGGGKLTPDFEGAKQYKVSPVPVFSIQRAGSPLRFRSPRDSGSIALVDFDGFRAGPAGRFIPARTASSYGALNGLGDVNLAVELGGFAYRRSAFATLDNSSPVTVMNALRDDPLKTLIQTEIAPQALDAYVVITKGKAAYGSRGRSVSGIGIIKYNRVFGSSTLVHALYTITLVDGHDLHVIGKRSAPPPAKTDGLRLAGPSRVVDDTFFLPKADGPAQNEDLKAATIDLIEQSLPGVLVDLRLVDKSIAGIH
jgi:hypothetical protein